LDQGLEGTPNVQGWGKRRTWCSSTGQTKRKKSKGGGGKEPKRKEGDRTFGPQSFTRSSRAGVVATGEKRIWNKQQGGKKREQLLGEKAQKKKALRVEDGRMGDMEARGVKERKTGKILSGPP